MSFYEGAMVQPIACCVFACQKARVGAGHSVIITGAGPMGVMCAMVAQASGACDIIILDISNDRLKIAEKALGSVCKYVLNDVNRSPKDTADFLVEKYLNSRRADVSMECSGAESCVQIAVYVRFEPIY